ncbi:MAG: helix-turn-helix domain-containing protein [bacterium]|nr:helix-turn-helix domain-containing protein [bacterium]
MPQNSILCITQSRAGYIWLGTLAGLVRFDGVSFTTYNRWNTPELVNDRVTALHEDNNGVLWVGTDGSGLITLTNGRWHAYSMTGPLTHNRIRCFLDGGAGNPWIGTADGLIRLVGNRLVIYGDPTDSWGYSVNALAPAHTGGFRLGTDAKGLLTSKNGNLVQTDAANFFVDCEILSMCPTPRHNLWIGTEKGLYIYRQGKIETVGPKGHPILGSPIRALMLDSAGWLWIGTEGEGVFKYSRTTGRIQIIPTPAYIGRHIRCFLETNDGNTWIGTITGGLTRLSPARVTTVTPDDGLPTGPVSALMEDARGSLWIATNRKGMVRLNNGKCETIELPKSIKQIRTLFIDRSGSPWLGTPKNGLYRLTTSKVRVFTTADGLCADDVTCLYEDTDGTLQIGTTAGLSSLKNNSLFCYPGPTGAAGTAGKTGRSPKKQGVFVQTITRDTEGRLWIGTKQGLMFSQKGQIRLYETDNGSPLPYDVLSLYADKNRLLWIGTNGSGLVVLSLTDSVFTRFTTDNGLPDNYLSGLLEDQKGNLWMGSYHGILRVSKRELREYRPGAAPPTVLRFDERDGMKSSQCIVTARPAAWKRKDKTLCFATAAGVAIINPDTVRLNTRQPKVIIGKVFIDGLIVDTNKGIVLKPGKRTVEFYFSALSFPSPDKVEVHYRLEGFDTRLHKVAPGRKRVALYPGLGAGDYRFRVIARNSDGVWNKEGAYIDLKIEAYFYKTSVFYAGLFLLLLIVSTGVLLIRSKGTHKKTSPFSSVAPYIRGKETAQSPSSAEIVNASSIAANDAGKADIHKNVNAATNGSRGPHPGGGAKKTPRKKYSTSALQQETIDSVLPRLSNLMEEEKIYLDADLTLQKLSSLLKVHYNHLSRIINERMEMSFNDYINSFRIEEAKRHLQDPGKNKKTILQVAFDTGFYSKSVFNTAFKKFTGTTPSRYRSAAKERLS